MDLELGGRTAVVVGGSSGIGAATARVFAAEGCDVALTYRCSSAGAQRAADEVRAHGRRAWVVPLDLARPESVRAAVATLAGDVGDLDALVLNAGHNVVTPFDRIGVGEWREVLEINLSGAFFTLQALAPQIRSGGTIVTVASVAAIDSLAEDYAATSLLLQRFATPQRVAQLIALVASPVTEYMTGATIDMNSGRFLR